MASQSITFIGIGNMGLAAVLALLKSDSSITIWNRTVTRPQVQTAVGAGAVLEEDLGKALSKSAMVFICLLDYGKIRQSLEAIRASSPSVLAGKTVVNLTNGTPRQAREMHSWLQETWNVERYFDGAIMVTPQMVGGPHSFLVASGEDEAAFSEPSRLLSPIGNPQYLGPDIAAAARYDLAALSTMYGLFSGSFIGMALLKRSPNPSIGKIVKESIVPFLTALVPYIGEIATAWDEERWEDNMGNPVLMQLEGVRNIVAACEEEGVDSSFMTNLVNLMEKVVEQHGGDAGVTAVGKLLLKD
ncbi:hypothetical protein B0T16DRAFT_389937 [Cercophora newfieldiana]|uniref:6-phosphogluconate dehydrogenase NADP-binding domain-containing protein n=1 Tax=Cercophora newfieldiana TaxID=92897 RepID=A0AA40CTD0_9PEZI|nr:hypothetical protein B0T16DRAFT_389937 [Cercophora newfieldiana]